MSDNSSIHYPLFEHMALEHGLTLTESELEDICQAADKVRGSGKECERLKAELAAWHSQFGSQLSHAVEERERLKAENATLLNVIDNKIAKGGTDRWERDKEIERLRAELAQARAEHRQTYELLLCKVKDTEAENARLTTELDAWQRTCGTRQNHIEDVEKLKAELAQAEAPLAPTIELLESVLRDDRDCSNKKIEAELARLRALAVEGKS